LSLLSYIATGVVSASTAIHYFIVLVETITGYESNIPEITATIILLFAFALLFFGLKESSVVALSIFIVHTFCLLLLMVYCFIYAFNDNWSTLVSNWGHELPTVTIDGTEYRNAAASIFMGYATALLGVSGFESSSQFVEEQKPGVFRKTLRNMWYAVAFFNPIISFLSFAVMPYKTEGSRVGILDAKSILLSEMAFVTAGHWLKVVMSIDAFIVLCGAVLTGYVGVNGLIRRIASDRCLPQFLLSENKWRGTNHYIIFGFFAFSSSLLIVLKGDESTLAGVYTYAFLGVMNILGWSCLILKVKRPEIPREETAPFWTIACGIIGTGIGLLGNILGKPEVLQNFVLYFLGIGFVMFSMYNRIRILKLLSKAIPSLANCLTSVIEQIHNQNIVFFTKHADLAVMAKAVMYVRENEQTSQLTFVHIRSTVDMKSGDNGEDGTGFTNDIFSERVNLLDKMFPKIKLSSIVIEGGEFDAPTIHYISDVLKIPQNFMFMASPSNFGLQKVGGLRIITS
jgi:amino acid transporter